MSHDQKELEDLRRRVADLERELEVRTTRLEQFAFHAAHDMQEPLRKISAFGERLQRYQDVLPERGRMYLGKMLDAAARMSNLIDDLLKYAMVGTRESRTGSVDLKGIFDELLDIYSTSLSECGAQVSLSGLEPVEGDRTQVRQLFQNLLSNAIKFRREGVPLRVAVQGRRTGDGMLEVSVADNGIGFDECYRDKIFQVFQRLHGRGEYEGSGIGLAVCARVVENQGGRLDARGRPGEGATFSATLPLAEKN